MDMGHWLFKSEFNQEDWFGFIYRIIDTTTGQMYIGKKQFRSTTRKPPLKGKTRKRKVVAETKWREYTSSSSHIAAAIEEKGKSSFIFLIESLHQTKASLYYAEVRLQIIEDVMRKTLDNGIPLYYNRQVGAVKFVPPQETLMEREFKMDDTASDCFKQQLSDKHLQVLTECFRTINR
jgi:hypothetical protein